MIKVETSIIINRPLAEVFAYVVDLNTRANWQEGLVEAKQTSSGPTGVGSTYRSTSGPFPLQGRFEFEPADGGTRVRFFVEFQPGGFFKLADPVLAGTLQKQMQTSLDNLKKLLEA